MDQFHLVLVHMTLSQAQDAPLALGRPLIRSGLFFIPRLRPPSLAYFQALQSAI